MATDPETIGYWARINNLTLADVLTHDLLGEYLGAADEQRRFRDGWEGADRELLGERLESLLDNLADVSELRDRSA